jgi:hypothetical protein
MRLVDGDVRQPGQQLGATVRRHARGEQFGAFIDEGGGNVPGDEVRVVEDRLKEGDVR